MRTRNVPQRVAVPLCALLALVACAGRGAKGDPFATVSLDDAERMMGDPGVVVIDANSRGTFEQNRLPGAVHHEAAPFAELLPPDRDARLLFYCASPS